MAVRRPRRERHGQVGAWQHFKVRTGAKESVLGETTEVNIALALLQARGAEPARITVDEPARPALGYARAETWVGLLFALMVLVCVV